MSIFILLISLAGLFWAAHHLVRGAAGLAYNYNISPLIIGLTIVAIGTSAPEIMVGLTAAFEGRNELALGNVIGSNIANIGLVLGITILLRPLKIRSSILHREYPLLFLIMLFTYSLMLDGNLSVLDGCLLLLGCLALIGYFIVLARKSSNDIYAKEYKHALNFKQVMSANWLSLVFGLCILPLSAHFLVDSTVKLTAWMGISELTAGLTIVAIGTSLPQLATSLVAAYRGYDDIAIGNILGSNMFNLLIVMAFPAIINPSAISHVILWRDIPVMFLITTVLLVVNYRYKKRIARWHGGLLLLIYCCYMISLVVSAAYK